MPETTEPQVWVLIGTFAAAILGGMTFSTNLLMGSLTKVITANTDRLEARIDALRHDTVAENRITRVELTAKIENVETGLSRLRGDLARIDADVSAIAKRVWNDPPAA